MNRGSLVSKKIYAEERNVFIVAYKRSEIYGSMCCQGFGMTPMFMFHFKKMFLKILRRRCHSGYYIKSWQFQEGEEGEKTDKLKETLLQQYNLLAFYHQECSGAFKCTRSLEFCKLTYKTQANKHVQHQLKDAGLH